MRKLLSLVLFLLPITGFGQIFGPEGLNMPGAWNSWTNPPSNVPALGSSTQVVGGEVTRITTGRGTGRYTTTFSADASGADVVGGSYEFLFTSGPSGSPYNNKWSGVSVSLNTIQTYIKEDATNNSITLTNGRWYTMNWLDSGYGNTSGIFLETDFEPVTISSVTRDISSPTPDDAVEVTITLSAAPSTGELVYLLYTGDNWGVTGIGEVTMTGAVGTYTIPAQPDGINIQYYALTTNISSGSWGSSNVDMLSLRASSLFSYTSTPAPDETAPTDVSDLSASASVNAASVTLNWTPVTEDNFDTYEIYYNTTGNPGLSDTKVDETGIAALGTRTTSSATITGLSFGTTYYFKIRAKDASSNVSNLSNTANTSTPALGYDLWLFSGLVPEGGAGVSAKGIAGLAEATVSATATGTAGFLYRRFDWAHKWGGPVTVNSAGTLSSYNDQDGSVAVTNGRYYTFNVPAAPAFDGSNPVAILETSALPVTISSVTRDAASPLEDEDVTVTVTLSDSKSAEELVYIRYTTNGWTSDNAVEATVSGTTGTAIIPGLSAGTVVSYYALTTTVSSASWGSNVDLLTLKANTNAGSNYSYTVAANENPTSGTVVNTTYNSPVTLTGNVTASGTVTIAVQINTGSNSLLLGSSGSLSGETPATYIVGTVQALPTINGALVTNIGGLGININPGTANMGATTVIRETGAAFIIGGSIAQRWTITPTTQPGEPVTVTLTWPDENNAGVDVDGTPILFKSEDGGTTWFPIPATSWNTAGNPNTVTFDVTSFSEFTIGDGDSPLPIELVSWSAVPGNQQVSLKWKTASEINNAGFEIYRSTSRDKNFINIASYRSNGKDALISKGSRGGSYEYVDAGVSNGITYYYRLTDVSYDGKKTDHAVIEAIPTAGSTGGSEYQKPIEFAVSSVYPNPFNPTGQFSFDLPEDGLVTIRVFNLIGQEMGVLRSEFMKKGRGYSQTISMGSLSTGTYLLSIEHNGSRLMQKFTILK